MIIRCCRCGKVRVERGTTILWLPPSASDDAAIARRDVSHGYCPHCTTFMIAEARRWKFRKQTKAARLRNFLSRVMSHTNEILETLMVLGVTAALVYFAALAWGFGSRMDELILGF